MQDNIAEMKGKIETGGGAQFWAYISPQNDTAKYVTQWEVQLSQGSWSGSITSAAPEQTLKTPGLSGTFDVKVIASGPNFGTTELTPAPDSKPNIGCNSNCAAMVGIVANADGTGANYWTTWDAICN